MQEPALVQQLTRLLQTRSPANDEAIVQLLTPGVEFVLRMRRHSVTRAQTQQHLRTAIATYHAGDFQGVTDLLELVLRLVRD